MFRKVPFYMHNLGVEELREVAKVFKGPILTTGDQVEEFERRFSAYLGVRDTVACTSWTGAAHIALVALGIGRGDEVITSPLTFIATATAIIQAGAKPVFVDCERETGNIDVRLVEAAVTKRTKAIMPIHLYGRMADMRALYKIAKKHDLKLIEDAAHCIEGKRDGVRPGQLSDAACFSFFATKNLACGEGGAVSFNNTRLSKSLRRLRLHGITKTSADREREGYTHWDMKEFGWKYNMDNIHAAILLAQFKKFPNEIKKRQKSARLYRRLLAQIPEVQLLGDETAGRHAHHLMPILVSASTRDKIIREMQKSMIGVVVNYRAIHELTYFRERFGFQKEDFPVAHEIGSREISLPFHTGLSPVQIRRVCATLRKSIRICRTRYH